ncbi:MAG TPA: DUF4179 domain-containing protein [Symbiobacteriaceae bacterium]|jgi:hypothetical protein|nr:DUF4179 domain-containing protein [Symbiobacteriaceae bacterium]
MNLEQQLKQAAEPWLAEESLSPEQEAALTKLIDTRARSRRARPRFWWAARAAAAAAVVLLVTVPVVTGMASDLPVIGPLVSRFAYFDRGTEWALKQSYIAPVGLQSTDQGYTFRIEGVMADAARTKIFWVIEGPNLTEETTYKLKVPSAPENGWYTWHQNEVTDGRLVGSTTVGPLRDLKVNVTLRLEEVAGVKGNWSVSFEASRAALDTLARRVNVGRKVQGGGYDLTVREVLFAPTETVVRVESDAIGDLEILSSKLLADGVAVPPHADISYARNERVGAFTGQSSLIFDRVEGEPAQLTLLIEELGRLEKGGPVLDLTKPGAAAEAEGSAFTVRSVAAADGETTVTLDVTGTAIHLERRFEWVLTGAAGQVLHQTSATVPTGGREMVLTFEGETAAPVKLEARQTLKTVARDLTVTLPTK